MSGDVIPSKYCFIVEYLHLGSWNSLWLYVDDYTVYIPRPFTHWGHCRVARVCPDPPSWWCHDAPLNRHFCSLDPNLWMLTSPWNQGSNVSMWCRPLFCLGWRLAREKDGWFPLQPSRVFRGFVPIKAECTPKIGHLNSLAKIWRW